LSHYIIYHISMGLDLLPILLCRGSKQLQGLASKGGTEENKGTAELEHY
jgi:hypothetical protein